MLNKYAARIRQLLLEAEVICRPNDRCEWQHIRRLYYHNYKCLFAYQDITKETLHLIASMSATMYRFLLVYFFLPVFHAHFMMYIFRNLSTNMDIFKHFVIDLLILAYWPGQLHRFISGLKGLCYLSIHWRLITPPSAQDHVRAFHQFNPYTHLRAFHQFNPYTHLRASD